MGSEGSVWGQFVGNGVGRPGNGELKRKKQIAQLHERAVRERKVEPSTFVYFKHQNPMLNIIYRAHLYTDVEYYIPSTFVYFYILQIRIRTRLRVRLRRPPIVGANMLFAIIRSE